MAQPGAIRAGRAFVEFFADGSKLVSGMNAIKGKVHAFGSAVSAIGTRVLAASALAAAPLIASVRIFARTGDSLFEMSQRTGVSVEALSELSYAAEVSGTSIDGLEKGLRLMQKNIGAAAGGSKAAQEKFAALGLTTEQLLALKPDEQFALLADRVAAIGDPTLRAAATLQVFGKSGTALLPMIEGGADGIAKLRGQAQALGLTMSTQDAEAAHVFSHALSDMWAVVKRAAFTIGASLAPVLQDLATRITNAVVMAGKWIDKNRNIIVVAAKVVAGAAAFGLALVVVGKAASLAAFAVGLVILPLKLIMATVAGVGAAITFFLSPVGLCVAAFAAVVAISGTLSGALDGIKADFAAVKDSVSLAWSGISDALAAGDLKLAARIAFAGIQLAWAEATKTLYEKWLVLRTALLDVFNTIASTAAAIFDDAVNAWRRAVQELSRLFAKVFVMLPTADREAAQKAWNEQMYQSQKLLEQRKQQLDAAVGAPESAGKQASVNEATRKMRMAAEHLKMVSEAEPGRVMTVEIDKSADAAAKAEDARHKQRQQNIADEMAATDKAIKDALAADMDAKDQKITDLQERRTFLRAMAAEAKLLADEEARLAAGVEAGTKASEKLETVATGGGGGSAAGAFSRLQIAALGAGGGPMDKIAAATAGTEKHTKRAADALDDMEDLAFE